MLVVLIIIFVIAYLWGKVIFSDQNTSNSSSSSSYNYQATHSTIESETPSSNESSHSNWYEDDNDYSNEQIQLIVDKFGEPGEYDGY